MDLREDSSIIGPSANFAPLPGSQNYNGYTVKHAPHIVLESLPGVVFLNLSDFVSFEDCTIEKHFVFAAPLLAQLSFSESPPYGFADASSGFFARKVFVGEGAEISKLKKRTSMNAKDHAPENHYKLLNSSSSASPNIAKMETHDPSGVEFPSPSNAMRPMNHGPLRWPPRGPSS